MTVTLFLAGDIMLGRGVDQVQHHSVEPALHEPYVKDARRYVEMAEGKNGAIPAPVDPGYVWGDALDELERVQPDARIVNLETAVTTSENHWAGKGIHYRMHPENAGVLTAAGIDCAILANNHVMDWGVAGLVETLDTLEEAGLATAGAGADVNEAGAPARPTLPEGGRVLVFAYGLESAGVPRRWAAGADRPGVALLEDLSEKSLNEVAVDVEAFRQEGDLVVISLHWGPNWGYRVSREERRFAHGLVDEAGADVIFGHSSHHPKGVGIHRGRPVVYGAGDFLNDYEGIGGKEAYRGDLVVAWLLTFRDDELERLRLRPFRIHRFRLERPSREDTDWLLETLDRESRELGAVVVPGSAGGMEARPA